ncbi:MAG TPA: gephyrin-like molybdotransferase Glp [Polyangiaceae bacterium]
MLELTEALRALTTDISRLGCERVLLGQAHRRVLAETLLAGSPMPEFDYSAMDGFAVRLRDFSGAGPWALPVKGESRTGGSAENLEAGAVCRIFTGAELPAGADSVVPQEVVRHEAGVARFESLPKAWANVRRRGEDLAAGELALADGARLGPSQLALAAALDRAELVVAQQPRVAIVCTGDELRAPGEAPRRGSIPESNSVAIAALCRQAGGVATRTLRVGDRLSDVQSAFSDALDNVDLVLSVGGASVGDYDVVRPALEACGVSIAFHKVNIKPGKPVLFGQRGKVRVLGLPGNPVSAQVTCLLFGVPLLRAMQGDRQRDLPWRTARLLDCISHKPGRHEFVRARLDPEGATPLCNQASGALISMAWADALVHVPAEASQLDVGETVRVLSLREL